MWHIPLALIGFCVVWVMFHLGFEKIAIANPTRINLMQRLILVAIVGNLLVFGLLLFFGLGGSLSLPYGTLEEWWIIMPLGVVIILGIAGLISVILSVLQVRDTGQSIR